MISRTIPYTVVGVVLAALLVPTAAADPPLKVPFASGDITGQFCEDFEVSVHATDDRASLHIFSSGEALITGTLKVEVTNLESGKTLALNISGPGKIAADGGSLRGTGRWLLFGEAGELGPGSDAGMFLVAGQLELDLDEVGLIETVETRGHVEDVCAALAGS